MSKNTPASNKRVPKKPRAPDRPPEWTSLPKTVGRPHHRLITKGQFDALSRMATVDLKLDASEALAAIPGVAELINHVTRFAVHPDFRCNHPSLDLDLTVTAVAVNDDASLLFDCTTADGGFWQFPFAELYPAGPMGDFTREAVRIMSRAVTEDMVAQLIDAGALIKPNPADLPAVRNPDWQPPVEVRDPARDWAADGGEGGGAMDTHEPLDPAVIETDAIPGTQQVARNWGGAVGGRSEILAEPPQSETVHSLAVPREVVVQPGTTSTTPGHVSVEERMAEFDKDDPAD